MNTEQDKKTKTLTASYRYPFVDLKTCLILSEKLYNGSKLHSIKSSAIYKDLGFSESSSYAQRAIASLKYYKLLETTEKKDYKLSEIAIDYSINKKLSESQFKEAIDNVPVYKKLSLNNYNFGNMPSDNAIKSVLIKSLNYTNKQAEEFISVNRKNFLFFEELTINNSSFENATTQDNQILLQQETREELNLPTKKEITVTNNKELFVCNLSSGNLKLEFPNIEILSTKDRLIIKNQLQMIIDLISSSN